jgi:UDP-N-acetylglucosamine:LPS N-acetylglucosamine transferase
MEKPKRVMAVASGGGHWIQLMRLMPAFAGQRMCFVSTTKHGGEHAEVERFHTVVDANRTTKFRMVLLIIQMAILVLRFRPEVVISTGAAPGYLACRLARMIGARTVWLDSIANASELSLSGRKAGNIVDLWLTQWEDLAESDGPEFRGAVL